MEENKKKTREQYEVEINQCLIRMRDTIKEAYENLTASEYDKFNEICTEQTNEILSEVEKITRLRQ